MFSDTNGPIHAVTDVYDEKRHNVLVQYPIWLIIGLALAGVAAFAITGFMGYPDDPALMWTLFRQPWLLFLWFCALIITLQISILRHPSLRWQLIKTLAVTITSIIVVAVLYLWRQQLLPVLERWLEQLLHQHILLRFLGSNPWTYTIINFGILALFVIGTARRWIRRSRGLPPNPEFDLQTGQEIAVKPEDLPSLEELVAGDLIAGALLAIVLAFIFRPDVINVIANAVQFQIHAVKCTVSLPGPVCPPLPGQDTPDVLTLTFIDLVLALILLPLGLLVLALSAVLSAMAVVGGVRGQVDVDVPAARRAKASGTSTVSEQVTYTLLDTLRAALDRRIHWLRINLIVAFRSVAWPLLIFIGVLASAMLSRDIRFYLHLSKSLENVAVYILPALAWGLVAALGIVFSAALLLLRWRVAKNAMQFLGLIGFIVLLTFWLFSLTLWGFNQLILFIQSHTNTSVNLQAQRWHPFDPPSWSTTASFVVLVVYGSIVFLRRARTAKGIGAETKIGRAGTKVETKDKTP